MNRKYSPIISSEVFPGFYATEFSPENIEREDADHPWEDSEYREYENRIGEEICNIIKDESIFKPLYFKLISPASYNYSTDYFIIYVESSPEQILDEFVKFEDYLEILDSMVQENVDDLHEEMLSFMFSELVALNIDKLND